MRTDIVIQQRGTAEHSSVEARSKGQPLLQAKSLPIWITKETEAGWTLRLPWAEPYPVNTGGNAKAQERSSECPAIGR